MTSGSQPADLVGGHVAPGFEPVARAFAENLSARGELGAAFAATRDGRPVVDLWGGVADESSGRPWSEDTLQLIFSGTKGLTALCMTMLLDRGQLRLEDPVARHWPEFAASGKQAITVAEVVSHSARLPGVRTPTSEQDLLDPQLMAERLASQAPETDPRASLIYHPLTYGWLCDALMRRIDGRSIGRFFAQEVAEPLGLELWIGLPAELEPRVSRLRLGPHWGRSVEAQADAFPGDELWRSIYRNPSILSTSVTMFNSRAVHAADIPGGNAIGTARSVARLYGALVRGGEVDGVRIVSAAALERAREVLASGTCGYTGERVAYGLGFALQSPDAMFGPARVAFGHPGAGGSLHGAWPEERTGFSYAMNEMRDDPAGDDRLRALLEALHACLTRASPLAPPPAGAARSAGSCR
jgi:CubicO group peptidase (beta-lactamase class C family)